MSSKVKIGVINNENYRYYSSYLQKQLDDIQLENEIVLIDPNKNQDIYLNQLLLSGNIDLSLKKLSNQPFNLENGVCNAIVLKRFQDNYCIYSRDNIDDLQSIFSQENNSIIAYNDLLFQQIKYLYPNSKVEYKELYEEEILQIVDNDVVDTIVFPEELINGNESYFKNGKILKLSPKEFPPPAATGILVLQCMESNFKLRLKLLEIIDNLTMWQSNVERKVMHHFENIRNVNIGIHCELDIANNFHVWANYSNEGKFNQIRKSSSTSFGLAENLANIIMNE